MENKNQLNSEIVNLNRQINSTSNNINLQNQKIHEINDTLNRIDEKTKITNKYTSGFNSIFGFIPKIFSWGKNKKFEEVKKEEISQDKVDASNHNHDEYEDELEKEIKMLNRNAKKLNENIKQSLSSTEKLNTNIDKTISKVNKAMINENKVLNK
jgi:hypothetical protein